jgi:polygalacturonase
MITDYGATPNDDALDTAAIQAAVDAAARAGGGTVRIPRGVSFPARFTCVMTCAVFRG